MTEPTHKKSLSDAEPVAYFIKSEHYQQVDAVHKHDDDVFPLYAAPQPQRLSKMKLLMVTTAYEQGVGKGIKRVDCNPWKPDTDEHDAWQLGYEEGLDRAPQHQREPLTEQQLKEAFGKLYPQDLGLIELAENNRDYALESIGARHHWTAFKAGAKAIETMHGIGVAK